MPKRAILTVADVPDPITSWEIDLALSHADREYTEELSVDFVRPIFNTIQGRRDEPGLMLDILAREVVRTNVLESENKRRACLGGIMAVYSHRNQMKIAADREKERQGLPTKPAVKQTRHPTEFFGGKQRILF